MNENSPYPIIPTAIHPSPIIPLGFQISISPSVPIPRPRPQTPDPRPHTLFTPKRIFSNVTHIALLIPPICLIHTAYDIQNSSKRALSLSLSLTRIQRHSLYNPSFYVTHFPHRRSNPFPFSPSLGSHTHIDKILRAYNSPKLSRNVHDETIWINLFFLWAS